MDQTSPQTLSEVVHLFSEEPRTNLASLERLGITDTSSLRAWLDKHGGLRGPGVHELHLESGMATQVCQNVIVRLFVR